MSDLPDDPSATFAYFSNEYAQAVQAYQTIEQQASTLLLMGNSDELRHFIAQFVAMASRARDLALTKDELNFADWFGELVEKAAKLSQSLSRVP